MTPTHTHHAPKAARAALEAVEALLGQPVPQVAQGAPEAYRAGLWDARAAIIKSMVEEHLARGQALLLEGARLEGYMDALNDVRSR